jgi:hypothetical protein
MRSSGRSTLLTTTIGRRPSASAGDELGLRHRAFGAVDQQDDPVDHAEDALHLAAEVGVAWGVDDVDPCAFPLDRSALRQNGDPAFLFQVVGIHRTLFHALVVAEGAGLAEELVDERGLAVVDVGDDRHVAKGHGFSLGLAGWAAREVGAPLAERARENNRESRAGNCVTLATVSNAFIQLRNVA